MALPLDTIVATTYQAELAHLSDGGNQHLQLSSSRLLFHICPMCVAADRMLTRQLTLPGITHCPRHQVLLATKCLCGKPLLPFDWYALPFTCGGCRLDWALLPSVRPERERVEREGKLLAYYGCFFSAGAQTFLSGALRLIADGQGTSRRKRQARADAIVPSLEHLVGWLEEMDLAPNDLQ